MTLPVALGLGNHAEDNFAIRRRKNNNLDTALTEAKKLVSSFVLAEKDLK